MSLSECIIGENYTLLGKFTTYVGKEGNYMTSRTTFPSGEQLVIGTDFKYQEEYNEDDEEDFSIKIYYNDDDQPDLVNAFLNKSLPVQYSQLPIELEGLGIQGAKQNRKIDLLKKLGLQALIISNRLNQIQPLYQDRYKPIKKLTIRNGIETGIQIIASGYIKSEEEPFLFSKEDNFTISGYRFDIGDKYIYYPEVIKYKKKVSKTRYESELRSLGGGSPEESSPLALITDYYEIIENIEVNVQIGINYEKKVIMTRKDVLEIANIPQRMGMPVLYGLPGLSIANLIIQEYSWSNETLTERANLVTLFRDFEKEELPNSGGIQKQIPYGDKQVVNTHVIRIYLDELIELLSGVGGRVPESEVFASIQPPSSTIPQVNEILAAQFDALNTLIEAGAAIEGMYLKDLPDKFVSFKGRRIIKIKDIGITQGAQQPYIFYIFPQTLTNLRTYTSVKNYITGEDDKNSNLFLGTYQEAVRYGLDGAVDYQAGITPANNISSAESIPTYPKARVVYTGSTLQKYAVEKVASFGISDVYFYSIVDLEYVLNKVISIGVGVKKSLSGAINDFKPNEFPQDLTTQVSFDYLSGTFSASGIDTRGFNIQPNTPGY